MGSFPKHANLWLSILAMSNYVINMRNLRGSSFSFLMLTILSFTLLITSPVDEVAKDTLEPFSNLSVDESYQSRDLGKVSQQVAKPLYDAKVEPTTMIPKQVGNMYTASPYAAFVSLIHSKHGTLVNVLTLPDRRHPGFIMPLDEDLHPAIFKQE